MLTGCPSAQAQLSISPTILELKAYPGGLQTFTVGIGNTGEQNLNCHISVNGLEVVGEGLPVAKDDAPRSCAPWITFQETDIKLAPGSGKNFAAQLRPPKKISGGYYAIISCLGVPEEAGEEAGSDKGTKASVKFRYQVQAVVLLTVPGPNLQAMVEPGQPFVETHEKSGGYTFNVPVRNRGNIHDRISGTLEIRSEAGQVIDRFDLKSGRGFILPEHERVFTSQGQINLPDGVFTAQVVLNRKSGGPLRTVFPFIMENGTPTMTEVTDEMRQKLAGQSAGFIVSPRSISELLKPGERRPKAIEIRNLTKEPIVVNVRPADWTKNEEGWDLIDDENTPQKKSAKDWLTLASETVKLGPLAKQRIPIQVQMPKDAQGVSYAAVYFDRPDRDLDKSPGGKAQRSVLLDYTARGTAQPAGQITKVESNPQANGSWQFTAVIANSGNVGFTPDVTFNLLDAHGNKVGDQKPTESFGLLQAGGSGLVDTVWSEVLDPGDYTLEVVLRFDENRPPVVERHLITVSEGDKTGK